MCKKKMIFFVLIILILTGCTKITDNLNDIVNATMSKENLAVNTVSTGYELYIPVGVIQLEDNEYNQKLKIRNRYVYLYVDTVSYYYRNTLNYKNSDNYDYYYKELNLGNKSGYIGIKKIDDDNYYGKIVYNYSKMEFYSSKEDLSLIVTNSLIIQNSIKYNDNLIKIELDSSVNDGKEIKYQLDKPKDSESTFSDMLQEYVASDTEEVVLPDED